MSDAKRLAAIRAQLAALDGADWLFATDGATTFVEARGRDGSLIKLLEFTGFATTDERQLVADLPSALRFLLGLVDRAIAFHASRAEGPPAGQGNGPDARSGLPSSTGRAGGPDDEASPAVRAAQAGRAKDYRTEAAMRCQDPAFKRFLIDAHRLESPATDERAAAKLRSLLGVTSRREINDSEQAVARWKRLRGDFENWKRVGR